jgi:hypothetical protein
MKLTKKQIDNLVEQVIEKINHYNAKTTKDVEVILCEMFNEDFDHIYSLIESTWKKPYRAITNRICKKIQIESSDQFSMQ